MTVNVYEIYDDMDGLYMHHDRYYNVLEDANDMIDVNVHFHDELVVVVRRFLVLVDVEIIQSI
jgi:hypothetical protein